MVSIARRRHLEAPSGHLLLDRNEGLDQEQVGTGVVDGIIPFKTLSLVERVCGALNQDVPDAALYAVSLEIPLAGNRLTTDGTDRNRETVPDALPSENPVHEASLSGEEDTWLWFGWRIPPSVLSRSARCI